MKAYLNTNFSRREYSAACRRVVYKSLKKFGYVLVFKETLENRDGQIKGNCDAELVLKAMIDLNKYQKAVIITGDGDFGCLVEYLIANHKLETVLAPSRKKSSWLLRKAAKNKYIVFMDGA